MRSRKVEDLNADILEGHYSAALCHLANISYRLGQEVPFNKPARRIRRRQGSLRDAGRMEEHLKENGVALDGLNYRLGRKLAFDAATESFAGDSEANQLLTRALPRAVRGARPDDMNGSVGGKQIPRDRQIHASEKPGGQDHRRVSSVCAGVTCLPVLITGAVDTSCSGSRRLPMRQFNRLRHAK